MTDKENFLKEYKKLYRKYKVAIGLNVITGTNTMTDHVVLREAYSTDNTMVHIDDFLDAIDLEPQYFWEFTGDASLHLESDV